MFKLQIASHAMRARPSGRFDSLGTRTVEKLQAFLVRTLKRAEADAPGRSALGISLELGARILELSE